MAIIRAQRLWCVTTPVIAGQETAEMPSPSAAQHVFYCPQGSRTILRHLTAVMTQYPPVGSQGVYNVILYAGGVDPAYTLHWFWFKNQTDAQGGLFVIDDQWDPMIVLNPGDIIAIGNTSGFPLTTSGSGHILPISQQGTGSTMDT